MDCFDIIKKSLNISDAVIDLAKAAEEKCVDAFERIN